MCICENSKHSDISVIECDEIITVLDIVSTKMTNAIAPNVTSTALVKKQETAIFCI